MFNNLKDLSKLTEAYSSKGKEILTVPVEDIQAKEQVRRKFDNIDELSHSILVEGLQNPIIVSPKENGKYTIQKGERRYRAIMKAGLPTIDVIVNNKQLDDVDWIAGQVVENIQRENLTSIEIASALDKLLNLGLNQKAICDRLGKSKSYVSQHVKLLELDSDIKELANEGIIEDVETLNNLQTIKNLDNDTFEKLYNDAKDEDLAREDTRRALRKIRANEEPHYQVDNIDNPFAPQGLSGSDDYYDDETEEGEEKERTPKEPKGESEETYTAPSRYSDISLNVLVNYISPEGEILQAKILTDRETSVGSVRIQLIGNHDNWRLDPFEVNVNEIELVRIGN